MESQELLKQQLARIRAKNIGKGTNWEKLETECLALIKDYNSPPDKGRIYATIARIYAEKSYSSSSEDVRIPKAIKYCKKALQHPLEATTACEMYGSWAGALMVKYFNCAESEFVKRRREAIIPCLTGLKLALDNKAPKERQKVPPVDILNFHGPKTHPIYQKLLKEHNEQLAKHRKAMLLNELYFQRWALTRICATLYSRKPYDIDELKSYADKVLKKYKEDVNHLIVEVQAEIAKKEKVWSNVPDEAASVSQPVSKAPFKAALRPDGKPSRIEVDILKVWLQSELKRYGVSDFTTESLVKLLGSEISSVRFLSASLLGERKEISAIPSLEAALQDESLNVQNAATVSLLKMGNRKGIKVLEEFCEKASKEFDEGYYKNTVNYSDALTVLADAG
ncbi:MAG: hypothetical protein OEW48_10115, partial [Phycisphaerae bacterium]|nr:hypothetical protein [Phycisphaerae bacterium]